MINRYDRDEMYNKSDFNKALFLLTITLVPPFQRDF